MNYTALAQWIETIAEREQLGPPWGAGSPAGIGKIIDTTTESQMIRAIYHVGRKLDWFTHSVFITSFLEYLRENGQLMIDIEFDPMPDCLSEELEAVA